MSGKMRDHLLAPFRWVENRAHGLRKWIDDPFTNGKIRLPPLFSLSHDQDIATTRQSVIVIPLYNLLIGGWSFLTSEVLGKLSYIVKALYRTGAGYNKDGYDYLGAFLNWSLNLLKQGFYGSIALIRAILRL